MFHLIITLTLTNSYVNKDNFLKKKRHDMGLHKTNET